MLGWREYDLEEPNIPALNRSARIEVKSTTSSKPIFSIAPKTVYGKDGESKKEGIKQRNNDMYVFCYYSTPNDKDILDTESWNFYVLPTQYIEADEKLVIRKSIRLPEVEKICKKIKYSQLCDEICLHCSQITSDKTHKFELNKKLKLQENF